jgi:hypothetical protein
MQTKIIDEDAFDDDEQSDRSESDSSWDFAAPQVNY